MEGAAAVEGGGRSNICLRPILSFLPPITTSNLCFSLRFHRIFPYQLQTGGERKWKKKGKPKKQKNKRSCTRHGPLFLFGTFGSFSFCSYLPFFFPRASSAAEVDNEEGENVYVPKPPPFIVHSQLRSQGSGIEGRTEGGRERVCSDDRRKYPA